MGYPKDLFVRTGAEKTEQRRAEQLRAKFDRLGRLSDSEKAQLEKSRLISSRATRRVFLGRAGAAIIGGTSIAGLAAAGLDPFGDSETPIFATPETQEAVSGPDSSKAKLVEAIAELPTSPLKELLQSRIVSLFTNKTPYTARRENLEFTVHGSDVSMPNTNDFQHLNGQYSIFGEDYIPALTTILKDDTLTFPLNTQIAQSGGSENVLLPFTVREGEAIKEGIFPTISVDNPNSSLIPNSYKEAVKATQKVLFVKEACSLLLIMLLAEQTSQKMSRLGLPDTYATLGKDGALVNINTVFSFISASINNKGRTLAATDIGGVLLAHTAMKGMPAQDVVIRSSPIDAQIIASLSKTDIGNTPNSILDNTFKWALDNNPWYYDLKTRTNGDITKTP